MPSTSSAWSTLALSRAGSACTRSSEEPADRLPLGGDPEVVLDREVVEQLQRLPGAAEPEPLALVGGEVLDVAAVEADPARRRDEPGEAVDERRLAGPVGTDQPDDLAFLDVEVDLVDGAQAAERHRHRRRLQQAHDGTATSGTRSTVAIGALVGRLREPASELGVLRAQLSGLPVGGEDRRDDQPEATEQDVKSLGDPDDLDEERPQQSARHEQAADDRPGDAGDAAEVGVGEEHERLQVVEAIRRRAAGPVGDDGAGDAGDRRREREGEDLGARRRSRRRPPRRVRWNGGRASADRSSSGAGWRRRSRARRRRRGRTSPSSGWAACRRRSATRAARTSCPCSGRPSPGGSTARAEQRVVHRRVAEHDGVGGHGAGERHDRQAHAAHAQRRHGDHHAGNEGHECRRRGSATGTASRARWTASTR